MIPYFSVPVASSIGLRPGYFCGNVLGTAHDPFQVGDAPMITLEIFSDYV